jgi:hypothetical protein
MAIKLGSIAPGDTISLLREVLFGFCVPILLLDCGLP